MEALGIDVKVLVAVLLIALVYVWISAKKRSARQHENSARQYESINEKLDDIKGINLKLENIKGSFNIEREEYQDTKEAKVKMEETVKDVKNQLLVIAKHSQTTQNLGETAARIEAILSNKQSRGNFGELQLYNLIESVLAPNQWEKKPTFVNVDGSHTQPDCLVVLPNPPGPVVVDSKFPLENYNEYCEAENDQQQTESLKKLKTSVKGHLKDIAEKYILPATGQTADFALMFLPSEAVFAEIQRSLPDVVDESIRKKVYMTSPSTLMAVLQTTRAVYRDVEMKKNINVVQKIAADMLKNVELLDRRARSFKTSYSAAGKHFEDMEKSIGKIGKDAKKIEDVDLVEETDTVTQGDDPDMLS